MDKLYLIQKARSLETRLQLLDLLNEIKAELSHGSFYPFTIKQLHILCNPQNDINRYFSFEIPKKSGGLRQICKPCGNLRWFQRCLNEIFKALYTPSPYAMGFAEGKSVVDNARIHTNQNYVFNIDLKDFFTSINRARVCKRLQLEPFNFNKRIASIIAGLCCIKMVRFDVDEPFGKTYVLPQGAPTSPLLTNAICDTLDRRLHGLAKRFGLHYSRYADDITFSSMHNVYQPESEFRKELHRIITEQHFTINPGKTRLCHCSTRQEVTGLIVGQKTNVARKFTKDLRAILHIWEKYGQNAALAAFYPHYKSEKWQVNRGAPNLEKIISGKLSYMRMVKGENDPVYAKLHAKFRQLTKAKDTLRKAPPIDYLFTMSKTDFEKKIGVAIEIRERANKPPYGCFYFNNRFFAVAISKNLDINNLSPSTMLSLIHTAGGIGYMLHKPLRGYIPTATPDPEIPEELRTLILSVSTTFSDFKLKDPFGLLTD